MTATGGTVFSSVNATAVAANPIDGRAQEAVSRTATIATPATSLSLPVIRPGQAAFKM